MLAESLLEIVIINKTNSLYTFKISSLKNIKCLNREGYVLSCSPNTWEPATFYIDKCITTSSTVISTGMCSLIPLFIQVTSSLGHTKPVLSYSLLIIEVTLTPC